MLVSLLHAAGTRLVAIVIGSVIGLVFLILSVILGIHIVRTVRKHRQPTPSPNDGEVVLPKYGTPHPVNRMFWQGRGNSMQMPRETPLQDAIDEQRLNVISKAMGRFSNIVSTRVARFSQQVKGFVTKLGISFLVLSRKVTLQSQKKLKSDDE